MQHRHMRTWSGDRPRCIDLRRCSKSTRLIGSVSSISPSVTCFQTPVTTQSKEQKTNESEDVSRAHCNHWLGKYQKTWTVQVWVKIMRCRNLLKPEIICHSKMANAIQCWFQQCHFPLCVNEDIFNAQSAKPKGNHAHSESVCMVWMIRFKVSHVLCHASTLHLSIGEMIFLCKGPRMIIPHLGIYCLKRSVYHFQFISVDGCDESGGGKGI